MDAQNEAEADQEVPEEDEGTLAGKLQFPELAKDASPSSLLVPAQKCIDKNIKKLDILHKRFVDATSLTEMQAQCLPKLVPLGLCPCSEKNESCHETFPQVCERCSRRFL